MSLSVDDLVSSLASNHIGQEAIDLAVLQTQLAETLFGGPSTHKIAKNGVKYFSPVRGRRKTKARVSTTPTARTPSVSSNNDWGMAIDTTRSRRNSVSSTYLDDMEEDEKMVEDLLLPSPPLSDSLSGSQFGTVFLPSTFQETQSSPASPNPGMFPPSYTSHEGFLDPPSSSPTASPFTTTDPFYLAQLQSLNNAVPHTQSVFAHNARFMQNSPFARSEYDQLHSPSQSVVGTVNNSSMPFGAS